MFVTDTILTTIMCAAKSVYSWDIVVTRVGDKLFFDKREGSTIDLLTVNETAPEQVGVVAGGVWVGIRQNVRVPGGGELPAPWCGVAGKVDQASSATAF